MDSELDQTAVPAPGRLQLYVDDPVVSVRSKKTEAHETFDLVIVWWLVLGIPLSWKKGSLSEGSLPHRWIGIDYTLCDEGAIMRLPPQFIKDLLALIVPLCVPKGSVSRSRLDVVCGKAARVAHVVPAAKPFVAGLWGALSGAEGAQSHAAASATQRRGLARCLRSLRTARSSLSDVKKGEGASPESTITNSRGS